MYTPACWNEAVSARSWCPRAALAGAQGRQGSTLVLAKMHHCMQQYRRSSPSHHHNSSCPSNKWQQLSELQPDVFARERHRAAPVPWNAFWKHPQRTAITLIAAQLLILVNKVSERVEPPAPAHWAPGSKCTESTLFSFPVIRMTQIAEGLYLCSYLSKVLLWFTSETPIKETSKALWWLSLFG